MRLALSFCACPRPIRIARLRARQLCVELAEPAARSNGPLLAPLHRSTGVELSSCAHGGKKGGE